MATMDVVTYVGGVETSRQTITISDEPTNAADIRAKAVQALVANATFLALGAPTNAQVLAQTQRLTRETTGVIRLLLGLLDDTSGT